ncbi:Hsp20/alpha crystallin family protein [Streptomyces sp. NPDC059853]|uniref:Hsp20/alpha crystallin family protein n=1 Tax=Streptomyces sp. NPDC059853 TaxID=3346973 RepID=UPI00365BD9B1
MTLPMRRRTGPFAEPLADFDTFFDRMSRMLESVPTPSAGELPWAPLADLHETDDAYLVTVELPGVAADDIDVALSDRELTVTAVYGDRKESGVLRRGTRRTGRCEYRTLLPTEVSGDDITAGLSDGVLRVTVPKAKTATPRHIEITTGE